MSQSGHKVQALCRALGVSRSGYYKWLNRKPSPSEKRLLRLKDEIITAYHKFKGIYGYRRITIYLNHYRGAQVNHKCVYRLMKSMDMKAVIRQKRRAFRRSKPVHTAENILNRQFQKSYPPMGVLLTDITEMKYGVGKKAYLSAILDYGANKIISYSLSSHNDNELVKASFDPILDDVIPDKSMIHSDRGSQYTSHFFKNLVTDNQLIHSMSRVGKCIDNGPMENFWGIIKTEMYYQNKYDSFEDLARDIASYITFYNQERVTLKMGLKIPA